VFSKCLNVQNFVLNYQKNTKPGSRLRSISSAVFDHTVQPPARFPLRLSRDATIENMRLALTYMLDKFRQCIGRPILLYESQTNGLDELPD